jgi:hypothetical protein
MPPSQTNQITEITGNSTVAPRYVRQSTLQYKTFIKRAVVESLQNAFKNHPDPEIAKTRIGIEYKTDRADFPAIIIKFYERSIDNIGVGHVEWGPSPNDPNYPNGPFTLFVKYYHRLYKGDLEFEVLAMSSVDRDKVIDALVEILAMADVTEGGLNLLERLYEDIGHTPFGESHFIAFNTDLISGYGEGKEIAPWIPEDTLVYTSSYRLPIIGEFYSLTPKSASELGMVQEVDVYPWDDRDPLDTPPENFPDGEIPAEDYIKFKGRPFIEATGTVTKESDLITGMSSVTGMAIGSKVTANGVVAHTTIVAIPSSTELTISEPAVDTAAATTIRVTDIQKKL